MNALVMPRTQTKKSTLKKKGRKGISIMDGIAIVQRAKIKKLEKKNKELRQQKTKLYAELARLHDRCRLAEDGLRSTSAELGTLERELQGREERITLLNNDIARLTGEVTALRTEKESTNRTLEIARANVQHLDKVVCDLAEQKESLRKDHQQILLFARLCLIPVAGILGPLAVPALLLQIQKDVQFRNDDGLDIPKMALHESWIAYEHIIRLMRNKKFDTLLMFAFAASQVFPPETP